MKEITLEELIELESKTIVLSENEYQHLQKNYYRLLLLSKISSWIIHKNPIQDLIKQLGIEKLSKNETYLEYRQSLPIQKSLQERYNHLLEDILELLDKISNSQDPFIDILLIREYLVENAYFSYTTRFHRMNPSLLENHQDIRNCYFTELDRKIQGSYIMAGYGCCRNINSFLADLIEKKGYVVDRILGISTTKESQLSNKDVNHMILFFLLNSTYYGLDGTEEFRVWKKENSCFTQENEIFIPDYKLSWLSQKIDYQEEIPFGYMDKKEIERLRKEAKKVYQENKNRFISFKESHQKELEILAYLSPVETSRSIEKENRKIKILT